MEVKVNNIYRYGNSIARVADINDKEIRLVTGAVVRSEDLHPAIPAGTVLETRNYPVNRYVADETIDAITDDTKVNDIPFFKESGGENLRIVKFPDDIQMSDDMLDMVKDFFDHTSYNARKDALVKILGEWKTNKKRLRKTLELSPAWNEQALALIWKIEVPDNQKRNEAMHLHNEIMKRYYREYNNDYEHCYKFDFDRFFDITDNAEFKTVNIKIACGSKPSRALRKYYEAIGAHRINDFERLYAKLADALSDKKLKRTIVLSIHPLDYLRMSYGNSWNSCHHIGNKGCFHAGTLSYLMDGTSMVCTLLPEQFNGETYKQPKINRMMFFLNEKGDVLQSRLYPQTRIPELEEILAKEVNAKIQEVLKIEGEYLPVVNDDYCDNYVWSIGGHYHDYSCRDYGQNIWSVKGTPARFTIGHKGVCINCGEINPFHNTLECGCYRNDTFIKSDTYYVCPNSGKHFFNKDSAHYNEADGKYYLETHVCPECGQVFFDKNELYCEDCRKDHKMVCCECGEEVTIVFDGKAYCDHCAGIHLAYCEDCGELHYREDLYLVSNDYQDKLLCSSCRDDLEDLERCEDCGSYHRRDDMSYVEGYGYICESCREEGGYYYCAECDELYRECDGEWVGDNFVCESCLERYYYRCNECGEYFREDDIRRAADGECYCDDCIYEYFTECEDCGEYYRNEDMHCVDGREICDSCYEENYTVCENCGEVHAIDDMKCVDDLYYCESCYEKMQSEETNEDKDEAEVEQFGKLTKNLDGRFREGQRVKILKKVRQWYQIELEDGTPGIYRYVDPRMVELEETVCA